MHDIVEISKQPELLLWWQWALIGLGTLLLLALASVLFTLSRKAKPSASQTPLERALQQLSQLDAQAATSSNQLAVQLSVVVRQYLQHKFGDNSLFLTDEEFHARSNELSKLPEASAEQLSAYLTTISEHKYAPNANHPAALESMIDRAASLVSTLDQHSNNQPSTSH